MEFFTKFPVMERSALAELRKSIDFVFTNEGVYALRNVLKLKNFEANI